MGIGASREAAAAGSGGVADFENVRIVRVGGKTEKYEKPVRAGEVMAKNPQHCLAKLEAFRNSEMDRAMAILSPEEVLMPGEQYFLLPQRTAFTLFKRQSIDNADLTGVLSPPTRKTSLKKSSSQKNWPRPPGLLRTPTRKVKEISPPAEDHKKRQHSTKYNAPDPVPLRRTLADHLQASPPLQSKLGQVDRSLSAKLLIEDDDGEVPKVNPDLVLLIDSAHAFLSRRRPLMKGGRSPTSSLLRSASLGTKRRPWVPRLQTLHEYSP